MASLLNTWNRLDLRKRAMLALALLATLGLMAMVANIATRPTMALLYGGMDDKASGEVAAALEKLGVVTEIRGDAIYVPVEERDRVRVALAKEGLPRQGQAGYELLDTLSGFGTTSEMFEASYWRAKEGELSRTIAAMSGVAAARVHLGAGGRRPFERSGGKSTASVLVRTTGGALSKANAVAIRYLVALSVAELDPQQVAVMDESGEVVLRPGDDSGPVMDESSERRAEIMRQKLERLLEPRVGDGAVRITVTVETSRESETVTERLIDPESRVTMNADTTEIAENSTGGAGAVTVASNLPDGDQNKSDQNKSNRTETRENVAYNYSQTQRNKVIQPGSVKKLGVAVLVDEVKTVATDGTTTYAPRGAEELAAIEELVKSAIAFDSERGDVVTVESMRFAPLPDLGEGVQTSLVERVLANNLVMLIQSAILVAAAAVLALFVVRPILSSANGAPADGAALALGAEEGAGAPGLALEGGATPEALEGAAAPEALEGAADAGLAALPGMEAQALAPRSAESAAAEERAIKTAVDVLREAVSEKTEESVALLKRWLHSVPTAAENAG